MGSTPDGRLTAAGIAAAVVLSLLGAVAQVWAASADRQSLGAAICVATVFLGFAAAGAVIAGARPGNAVGWVALAGAAVSALGNGGAAVAHHGLVTAPGSVAGASAYAVAGPAARAFGWSLLTLVVPTIFPDGRLPRPGWRWLRWLLAAILVASVIGPVTDEQSDTAGLGDWRNPIALHGPARIVSGLAFVLQGPLSVVAAGGVVALLVSRWRRGAPLLRQQLLLFVLAAALPVLALPVVLAVGVSSGAWVFGLTALPLPFAIAFAVLARGLYDLRSAANRTLVWLTLSTCVVVLYAVLIVGIGNRFGVRDTSWLPWIAAAVVALSFAPLRDALQRGVNRLTFGRWDQPYDVLAGLGQRLEASADVHRLLERVVDELHGLGLGQVAIRDATGTVVCGDAPATGAEHLALTAYGRRIGTLTYDAPSTRLRERDHRLLDDLAGHLGGVLHAHRLTGELQAAREHLVQAREEERRRLRRDLHDGLGPSLAGHLLRLDVLAARLSATSPLRVDVVELRDDLRATMLDVRRVVEGLRPPALDELGLAGALEQVTARLTAGGRLHCAVDVDAPRLLPAAVEVAAFRIATEAVTNVVRHAEATRCRVGLALSGADLVVEVTDDGCGAHSPTSDGNGLATMRERAEELGGTLTVTHLDGTRVRACLPLTQIPPQAAAPATAQQRP